MEVMEKPCKPQTDARAEFLGAVSDLWPVAKGSLARVARPCGRPRKCAACRAGRRHPMWIFTFRQEGRLRCRYVPADLVETLRRAVGNGRKWEKRLVEEGVDLIERHRAERSARETGK